MQHINSRLIQTSILLNESPLNFEGRRRPLEVLMLRDGGGATPYSPSHHTEDRNVILQGYFNDIYNMFLSRLTALVMANKISEYDSDRIKALLVEIIKVKGLIEHDAGYKESKIEDQQSGVNSSMVNL